MDLSKYPYHVHQYVNATSGAVEQLPCKDCRPGEPCATIRGTFDPFPGTDATMFIQWKGTDVCMDFNCPCGYHSHLHGMFGYAVECSGCEAIYEMGTQVKARRMDEDEAERWRERGRATIRDDDDGY